MRLISESHSTFSANRKNLLILRTCDNVPSNEYESIYSRELMADEVDETDLERTNLEETD
jgi:hypothetical protein